MLRVIKELRPTYVIGENVPGINGIFQYESFSEMEGEEYCSQEKAKIDFKGICERTGENTLWVVLDDLKKLGYSIQPLIIPACAVDAPHRRNRVWIVAHDNAIRRNLREPEGQGIYRKEQTCNEIDTGREDVANANRDGTERNQSEDREGGGIEQNGQDVADAKQQQRDRGMYGTRGGLRKPEKTLQNVGRGGGQKNGLWLPEPSVGRVVARFSSTLDETIKDFGYENSDYQKAITKIDAARGAILREMWCSQCKTKSSPHRHEGKCSGDFVYEVSCLRTHERWKLGQRIKKDKKLRDLWERICAKSFQETQNLQQRMLKRIRSQECNEKVASSRVDRLRSLGNAVVPQVVEVIGRMIIQAHKEISNDKNR